MLTNYQLIKVQRKINKKGYDRIDGYQGLYLQITT